MQQKLKDMSYSHIASAASCSNSVAAQQIIPEHSEPPPSTPSFSINKHNLSDRSKQGHQPLDTPHKHIRLGGEYFLTAIAKPLLRR
jgi:hypothetical protein